MSNVVTFERVTFREHRVILAVLLFSEETVIDYGNTNTGLGLLDTMLLDLPSGTINLNIRAGKKLGFLEKVFRFLGF